LEEVCLLEIELTIVPLVRETRDTMDKMGRTSSTQSDHEKFTPGRGRETNMVYSF